MTQTRAREGIASQTASFGVEKIAWYLPHVGEEELAEVAGAIRSNFVNMGPKTRAFEERVAKLLGARHAIATTSGTTAITLALMAAGVGAGDEVIVPALTFIGTLSAVKLAGAEPVLVDIRREDFNMSPESALAHVTGRTRAIMPVHINGRYASLESLRAGLDAMGRQDVLLVEDAAEALCSRAPAGFMGTLGCTGATSFAPTKLITTGQGGMVFTQDDRVAERLIRLRDQGRIHHNSDEHDTVGFNFKFTDLQAGLGLAQLEKLPHRVHRAIEIYDRYADGLADIAAVRVVPYDRAAGEVPLWTDIVCDGGWDRLYTHLLSHGVSCRPFWTPIHRQPPYRRPDADYPNAGWAHENAMWLPGGPTLTNEQQARVISLIRDFFGSS